MKLVIISFCENPLIPNLISSYLKEKGHEVNLIYIRDQLNQDNTKQLIQLIKSLNPDFIGIEVFTISLNKAKFLTNELKKQLEIKIIWGGPHTIIEPETSLNFADAICIGEAEESLLNLLNHPQKTNINGIWFKKNNKIIKNPPEILEENLDKYPFPDYSTEDNYILTKTNYKQITKELIDKIISTRYPIITSRGCPFSCTFCDNNHKRKKYIGRYFRKRSVNNIIKELELAKQKFKYISFVQIWDDLFLSRNLEEIKEFSKLYKEKINLPLECNAHFSYITKEKIQFLKEAGLREINIGIESGSEKIRYEVYNKKIPQKLIIETANYLNRLSLTVRYNLIFNNPYENIEDLKETIELFLKFPRPFEIQGFNLVFFPGTELYERTIKDNFIEPKQIKEINNLNDKDLFDFSYEGQKDNPLYKLNFSNKEKIYYNKLITLTPTLPRKFLKYAKNNENQISHLSLISYNGIMYPIKFTLTKSFEFVKKHPTIKVPLAKLLIKSPRLVSIVKMRKWFK